MASLPLEQPQSGSPSPADPSPQAQQSEAPADSTALENQHQLPADSPQAQQSQKNAPMRRWILEAGVFLILIGAVIWIRSSLPNNQNPIATVMGILFVAVGLIAAFVQALHLLFPPKNDGVSLPPAQPTSPHGKSRLVQFRVDFGISVIGIIVIILVSFFPHFTPAPNPPQALLRTGKSTGSSASFAVYPNYDPSGYVGDTGDIKSVAKEPGGLVRFTYIAKGQRPHEWEYKYIDGVLNLTPCQFAGVLYLDSPNNFGTDPHGGYDLRGRHIIKWQARSLNGPAYVEFVAGGVVWMWDEKTHTRVPVPYPDSMPRTSLGIQELTETWQTFQFDLSALSQDELRDVVAGFGWVITWDSNGVELNDAGTEAQQPKTFIIEIQGIAYER